MIRAGTGTWISPGVQVFAPQYPTRKGIEVQGRINFGACQLITQYRSIVVQSAPAVTQFNSQFIDATTIMGYCNNTNHLKVGLPRVIHKFYILRIAIYTNVTPGFA